MMKLPTGKQMAGIDNKTIQEFGFPSILLMENAGIGITNSILHDFPEISHNPVVIFIGPGNNGGDAFVIARQLYNKGIPNLCVFIGDEKKLMGDAKINHDLHVSLNLDEKNSHLLYINSTGKWEEYKYLLLSAEFLIDGLFGTGINGQVRGIYKEVISSINNEFSGKVLSIDVPSGLICDDVPQHDVILNAYKTYTIGLPKLGMLDYPGKAFCGKIETIRIGFPVELLTSDEIKTCVIDEQTICNIKPTRNPNSNKGNYGHTLVIAGSGKYPGAAHLTSLAANKAGAGLVTLASMFTVCNSLVNKQSEIIIKSFSDVLNEDDITGIGKELLDPDNSLDKEQIMDVLSNSNLEFSSDEEYISEDNFNDIKDELDKYNSAVIGPGIGTSKSTAGFVKKFISCFDKPVVVDADALNIISHDLSIFKTVKAPSRFIFTPHIGEFSRLCGKNIEQIKKSKVNIALNFAKEYGVILVLKDSVSTITDGEYIYFNPTGNCGLARGGSGDVLAGIIGAMLSRGLSPINAALFSVYLHGLVSDLIAKEKGLEGVFPTEIINNFYKGFLQIEV